VRPATGPVRGLYANPTSFGCVTQAPGSYQDNELLQTFVTDAETSPARLRTEPLNGLNQPYLIADRRGLSPTRGPSLIYYVYYVAS
jgi:hypothetical protein